MPFPLARATRRMTGASSCPTRLPSRPWGSARDPEPEPLGAVRSPGRGTIRRRSSACRSRRSRRRKSSKGRIALKETAGRARRHDRGSGIGFLRIPDARQGTARPVSDPGAHEQCRPHGGRPLVPEDRAGCARVLEALSDAPALGTLAVEVPGNGRRQARASASLGPGDGHHDRGDQARRTAGTEAIS